MWARAIIHADLDAFYASVEQLRHPELRGRPVIVGGGSDADGQPVISRGVVSAASYEARKFGVRSAMPLATALRQCPTAVVVPVDFPAYRAASAQVFAVVRDYTPVVEPLSLDEAYLDVTASQRRFGDPGAIAATMRDRILAECGLHASFGVAACKVVAKVASDLQKPRGLVVVEPGQEAATLAPLPLRTLPGLGPATATALTGLGVSTLGELAALPLDIVCRRIGQGPGRALWERARGIDDTAVTVPGLPKSISREQTFAHDIGDRAQLEARLRELGADIGRRLRAQRLSARTVAIRLRYADFSTVGRQKSLPSPIDSDLELAEVGSALFDGVWSGAPVRLLGLGSSGFEAEVGQLDLFSVADSGDPVVDQGALRRRDRKIDQSLDDLRQRFGASALRRGVAAPLQDLDYRGEDLRPQDSRD